MLEFHLKTAIKKIGEGWYAFAFDAGNVYSIGADSPKDGGRWFGKLSDAGIQYVSTPSPTRNAAYQKARRNGEYAGEW